MAVIALGPMFAHISGSIGGWVFGTSRYGRFIRVRSTRRRIPGVAAQQYMTWVAYIAYIWNTNYTQLFFLTWKSYADLHPRRRRCGSTSTDTAYGAFQRINLRRLRDGLTITLLPPA